MPDIHNIVVHVFVNQCVFITQSTKHLFSVIFQDIFSHALCHSLVDTTDFLQHFIVLCLNVIPPSSFNFVKMTLKSVESFLRYMYISCPKLFFKILLFKHLVEFSTFLLLYKLIYENNRFQPRSRPTLNIDGFV